MKVTRENASPIEITLAVELAPEDENPFIERSYRRAVSRINVPGFRRGRAPRRIVEGIVGRSNLVQEALEFMLPETLDKILQEEAVSAFAEPSIQVIRLEPVSFRATVPLEPTVELGDYRAIRVESGDTGIDDEEVDRALVRLLEQHTVWEPVERPAQFGDRLNIDVNGMMDGETVVDDRDVEYVANADNVLPFPGFASNLVGASEDDEIEFSVTVAEDYPREQYAGREVAFKVTVLSVKEKNQPELDDEFAKSVGLGFDDLAALRANILESITSRAEAAARDNLEEKSLAALCEVAVVNASRILYERELDAVEAERERVIRQQGLDMPTYLRFMGKSAAEFRDELRPGAERRLIGGLVMRKLAEAEQIEVTDADVAAEAERLLGMSENSDAEAPEPENRDTMREFLTSESTRDNIRLSLHNQRIMDRLTDITQGKLADAEPEAAGADTVAADADATAAEPEDAATAAGVDADAAETEDAIAADTASESDADAVFDADADAADTASESDADAVFDDGADAAEPEAAIAADTAPESDAGVDDGAAAAETEDGATAAAAPESDADRGVANERE